MRWHSSSAEEPPCSWPPAEAVAGHAGSQELSRGPHTPLQPLQKAGMPSVSLQVVYCKRLIRQPDGTATSAGVSVGGM